MLHTDTNFLYWSSSWMPVCHVSALLWAGHLGRDGAGCTPGSPVVQVMHRRKPHRRADQHLFYTNRCAGSFPIRKQIRTPSAAAGGSRCASLYSRQTNTIHSLLAQSVARQIETNKGKLRFARALSSGRISRPIGAHANPHNREGAGHIVPDRVPDEEAHHPAGDLARF